MCMHLALDSLSCCSMYMCMYMYMDVHVHAPRSRLFELLQRKVELALQLLFGHLQRLEGLAQLRRLYVYMCEHVRTCVYMCVHVHYKYTTCTLHMLRASAGVRRDASSFSLAVSSSQSEVSRLRRDCIQCNGCKGM